MSDELNQMIRRELKARDLSERSASERAGLSAGTLNYVLKHPNHRPDPDTVRKLAQFFRFDEDHALMLAGHRTAKIRANDFPDFPIYVQRKFPDNRLMREVLSNVYETIRAWEEDNPIIAQAASTRNVQNVPPEPDVDDDFPG